MAADVLLTENDLEKELLRLYQEGARIGYRANRFYQLFMPHCQRYVGGIKAVEKVVSRGRSDGFQFALDKGRPDLLLEYVVLDPRWASFFSDSLKVKAEQNLREKGLPLSV